jgi:hypothetical protein
MRVTCHEVNAQFGEWNNENYRMERIRVRSNLVIISLTSVEFHDNINAILKK